MTVIIRARFRQRRKTAAAWTAANEVLYDGEIGVEEHSLPTADRLKIGDGATPWNSLPYSTLPMTLPLEVDVDSTVAVSLTTGTAVDIAFLDLPVGVWLVTGNVSFYPTGTTEMSILRAWISDVSATQPSPPNLGAFQQLVLPFSTGSGQTLSAGSRVVTVSSGTTRVYLGTRSSFSVSTLQAGGHMIATVVG